MPKKPQRNSYFYFMLEFKQRESKNGRTLTMSQVSEECAHEWAKMGPTERRPFELKAKEGKQGTKVKKYTSNGENIDLVLKREKEAKDNIIAMQRAIENIVISSPNPPDLDFCVGYVNYYCFCASINRYLPAEISIVRFNLRTGVDLNDMFHVILDIGVLPIGYCLVASKHADEDHGIPIPPHANTDMSEISQKNMQNVLNSMLDFLKKNLSQDDPIPPIYFEESNIPVAKDVFKNVIIDYGDSTTPEIKVYSLLQLFYQLHSAANKGVFPITLVQHEIERDVYDYVQGISCDYHTVSDKYPFCSLSRCIRKIFIICDYTSPAYNIQLIAGKHVPKNACIEKLVSYSDYEQNNVAVQTPSEDTWEDDDSESARESEEQEAPRPKPKDTKPALRPPMSTSFTQAYREPPPPPNPTSPNYNTDFPALGGAGSESSANRPRPSVIGRGRGRILEKK